MRYFKVVLILLFAFVSSNTKAQNATKKPVLEIQKRIDALKLAHLNSDINMANNLYHENLILISQSGKQYTKTLALKNIENTFEIYSISDLEILHVTDNVIITNYINERKYKNIEKGIFRVALVWIKTNKSWQIISMQSSRLKNKKNKE